MQSVNILDIPITNLSKKSVLYRIDDFLYSKTGHYVVTANPEILMYAQKDEQYKNILQKADLVIPDGTGLMWAAKHLGQPLAERIPGSEFVWDIIRLSSEKHYKVYLVGGQEGVAEEAAEKMREKYGGVEIVGAEEGVRMENGKWKMEKLETQNLASSENSAFQKENEELINRVNAVKPDILLVAFGHPKQEYWIAENLPKMPSVRLAMGVGGTFNFISGRIRRAPRIMQKMGIEWLWRLIRQPWRVGRIWTAIISFPLAVWAKKGKCRM